MNITHVIPQIGYRELTLYEPATIIYQILKQKKEINRLNKVRHLGAFAYALQGARLSRWDYSVAMIFYSTNFKIDRMQGNFRIGNIQFTSAISALQSLSLIWNTGHLPGTFATEKGICRFLLYKSSKWPIYQLGWRFSNIDQVKNIIKESNKLFLREDYRIISRILAIYKLLSYVQDENDWLFHFVLDFVAPFLLRYNIPASMQWGKLRSCFKIVRHLAYLTIDTPMSGIRWAPHIPTLAESLINNEDGVILEEVESRISEILSPFEKNIYKEIYHRIDARKEAAILSESVYKKLIKEKDGLKTIKEWLKLGLKRELLLGRNEKGGRFIVSATVKIRSHFISLPNSYLQLENSLRKKKFEYPIVFEYQPWNSDLTLEPNEITIDVVSKIPTTQEIGRLIAWVVDSLDNINTKLTDTLGILKKEALLDTYKILLSRAIEIKFGDIFVKIKPWNFEEIGLFDKVDSNRPINIWASNAVLGDSFTRHLTRIRSNRNVEYRYEYQEVLGMRELRRHLRRKQRMNRNRNKYLVVAGSVVFCNKKRDLIEYDGGILQISSKKGHLIWYGLESKKRVNPMRYLRKKLKVLGVKGKVSNLTLKHAYVEMKL